MEKQLKDLRISFRATEKTVKQLAELQRILGARLGAPVSQGQAVAMAIDSVLQSLAKNSAQGRLI